MVGAPRQDGDGAIDLLGQHGPDQGMGPGLRPKRHASLGLRHQGRIEAIGPADHQDKPPSSVIPQPGDFLGEGP